MKLVYNALIRSVLDYGTFLLEPCIVAGMKKLDTIQAKALRIITGAMKSSPINALQVECVEPPLTLRRQFLADRFFFRFLQFSEHPLFTKLISLSDLINSSPYWTHKSLPHLIISYNKFKTINVPTYRTPNLPLFQTNYKALTLSPDVYLNINITKGEPCANIQFNLIIDERWQDWHHIYCDASKHSDNDCVGVGLFHQQYNIVEKIKFPPQTSIFTAECYGIYKALEYINLFNLNKSVIFTDSKSALQALSKFPFKKIPNSPICVMARERLANCIDKGYSVSFAWIPSHTGIKGNEKADHLANEAIECGDLFPYMYYTQDLAALPRIHLRQSWSEAWKSSTRSKAKYYYQIQPQIPTKPWFFKPRLSKRATSVLIRMRLGHLCSPAHLARIRILDSASCECGEDVGDVNHILFSCPLFDHTTFFTELINLKIPLPSNIQYLLHLNHTAIHKALASFIEDNDLKL